MSKAFLMWSYSTPVVFNIISITERECLHGCKQTFTESLLCDLKITKRKKKDRKLSLKRRRRKQDTEREIEQVAISPEVVKSSHTQHILLQMLQAHQGWSPNIQHIIQW